MLQNGSARINVLPFRGFDSRRRMVEKLLLTILRFQLYDQFLFIVLGSRCPLVFVYNILSSFVCHYFIWEKFANRKNAISFFNLLISKRQGVRRGQKLNGLLEIGESADRDVVLRTRVYRECTHEKSIFAILSPLYSASRRKEVHTPGGDDPYGVSF